MPGPKDEAAAAEPKAEPKPAFKIKQFITSRQWDVGEVHGADEFPPGTDFARLLELGAIKPMPGTEVHGGDPKVIDLLDQVEDLGTELATAKENASQAAAQHTRTMSEKDREIGELKQQLARAKAGALNPQAVGAEKPPGEGERAGAPAHEHHKPVKAEPVDEPDEHHKGRKSR